MNEELRDAILKGAARFANDRFKVHGKLLRELEEDILRCYMGKRIREVKEAKEYYRKMKRFIALYFRYERDQEYAKNFKIFFDQHCIKKNPNIFCQPKQSVK